MDILRQLGIGPRGVRPGTLLVLGIAGVAAYLLFREDQAPAAVLPSYPAYVPPAPAPVAPAYVPPPPRERPIPSWDIVGPLMGPDPGDVIPPDAPGEVPIYSY